MYMNRAKRDPEWDWISITKVSIKKLNINKKLFNYPNEVKVPAAFPKRPNSRESYA